MFFKKCFYIAFFAAAVLALAACVPVCNGYAQEKETLSNTTLDNLIAAYDIESNAQARYMEFAKKANREGYDVAASLFRAASMAEQVHADRHAELIKSLGGVPKNGIEAPVVKSTAENIKTALDAQTYENKVMYPEFLMQAEKDGAKEAAAAFRDAQAAQEVHAKLFERMQNNLAFSKDMTKDFYVCPLCGNILDALILKECPICGTDKEKFKKVMEY